MQMAKAFLGDTNGLKPAQLLSATPARTTLIVIKGGRVEVIHPPHRPARPAQIPEGMSAYDAAILRALTDNPMTVQRLARTAGHRHNSYLRERLAALVEQGYIRHTCHGYAKP
jgi:hypothetical protein